MRFSYSGFMNLKSLLSLLLCSGMLLSSGLSFAQKDPDPWRGVNEKTHAFNEFFDRNLLKPVAKGYNYITPEPLNKGITNFFSNLGEPVVMVNDLLQGKGKDAAVDLGRFGINTTLGLLGFFDVATRMSLHKNNEDFGQTLGKWGVPSGPYVVIPFLGPSTVRDGLAKIPASFTNLNPIVLATDDPNVVIAATAIDLIDTRADLLKLEKMIIGDRYTGMRDIYLQLREYDVKDGQVEDDFMSEDW